MLALLAADGEDHAALERPEHRRGGEDGRAGVVAIAARALLARPRARPPRARAGPAPAGRGARAPSRPRCACGTRGAERREQVEAVAVLVAEVEARRRHAARLLEAGHHDRAHLVDLEDVRRGAGAAGAIARLEIEALAEEALDARLDAIAQRLEETRMTRSREDGVQVHRVEPAELDREEVEDDRDAERERRRDEQAREQLVEVEQALVAERLGEHEEEHDREHGADGRPARLHGEEPGEVDDAREPGRRADDDEEAHAPLRVARGAPLAALAEREEARGEQPEDVEEDGRARERRAARRGARAATSEHRRARGRRRRAAGAARCRPRAGPSPGRGAARTAAGAP